MASTLPYNSSTYDEDRELHDELPDEQNCELKVTRRTRNTQPNLESSSFDTLANDNIHILNETKQQLIQNAPTVDVYHKEYAILRQIASGTFGSVHCVRKKGSNFTFEAAKYIKTSGDALHREVSALISLKDSDYILQFVAYYKQNASDIKSVLVTEYLEGGDLCERTASKSYFLTEHKCRTIMRQILLGVSYMHSHNFVHFDLKPFNVVFAQAIESNTDRDLRIIDFGLARELTTETQYVNIGMAGTIEYMSPEVMNCSNASYPADMWGVGCIAYQLLSGGMSPFFDRRSRFRTMEKVLDCNYSIQEAASKSVSIEALEFVKRLLILNPDERMTAAQCLSHSWLQRYCHDDSDLHNSRSPSPKRMERHSAFAQYRWSDMHTFIRAPEPQEAEKFKPPDRSQSLEMIDTSWMRRSLARRRWHKVYSFLRAVNRFKPDHFSSNYSRQSSHDSKGSSKVSRDSGISEKDFSQLLSYWKSQDKE